MHVNEQERLPNITLGHKVHLHPYSLLPQAVSLLSFVCKCNVG
jgi:hypothetical protein